MGVCSGWRRLLLLLLLGLQEILEELDGLGAQVSAQLLDQLIQIGPRRDFDEQVGFRYEDTFLGLFFFWHSN